MLRSALAVLAMIIAVSINPCGSYADEGEKSLYKSIAAAAAKGDRKIVIALSDGFLKKYPKSSLIPEVYFLAGESQSNPLKALHAYEKVVTTFPKFPKNDLAHYRICEIRLLLAQFELLGKAASRAIALYPKSHYVPHFRRMLVHAYYNTGQFEKAKTLCSSMLEDTHNAQELPQILMNLARIEKKISGYSRVYITHLRDIAAGFPESAEMPETIFRIGEFYEERKMLDHAYSSYKALLAKYPGSPESEMVTARIKDLSDHNPKIVDYIPDAKIISETESIDLSPDIEPETEKSAAYFAIAVGPLDTAQHMKELRGILKEFQSVSLKRKSGYMLYVGKCATTDMALALKIRLAEEFGINGSIVKFGGDNIKKYIYGE